MHMNRGTVGFVTALVMAYCFTLGGFASPAAAETIVVTTLTDTADPPFNADGPCGAGTIKNLPGADGLISLREAIIAANNTTGEQIITFAPSLSGGTIVVSFDDLDGDSDPDPLPALCGGQTRLQGDLNGDDAPDITLEGSALPAFVPAAGLLVLSSHNTIRGLRVQHFPFGIVVTTAGSDTQLTHTTVTDNEVRENGFLGIYMVSLGDRNVLNHATLARNTVSSNFLVGILIHGGSGGADDNTLETDITDNTVTDNGFAGIEAIGGVDNSSHNHVTALIRGNTVERGHRNQGIGATAGIGAVNFPTGASNNNLLDVRIERNTVRNQIGEGMHIAAGEGSPDGRAGAVANSNYTRALVVHNTVDDNTAKGIELDAGDAGLANANTFTVRVADNTVCRNTGTAIIGEGGFSGDVSFPPNLGVGNVLEGEISKNTATTVTVADGAGAPGNQANVRQFKNDPCP